MRKGAHGGACIAVCATQTGGAIIWVQFLELRASTLCMRVRPTPMHACRERVALLLPCT